MNEAQSATLDVVELHLMAYRRWSLSRRGPQGPRWPNEPEGYLRVDGIPMFPIRVREDGWMALGPAGYGREFEPLEQGLLSLDRSIRGNPPKEKKK